VDVLAVVNDQTVLVLYHSAALMSWWFYEDEDAEHDYLFDHQYTVIKRDVKDLILIMVDKENPYRPWELWYGFCPRPSRLFKRSRWWNHYIKCGCYKLRRNLKKVRFQRLLNIIKLKSVWGKKLNGKFVYIHQHIDKIVEFQISMGWWNQPWNLPNNQ